MTITLDKRISEEMGDPMAGEGEIKLPFPAPVFWVLNGRAELKQLGGARYYGGWATNAEDLDDIAAQINKPIPAGLAASEFIPREAKEDEAVNIYSARFVSVALISRRLSSMTKDGQRFPGYHKGASPHLQALCYLAYKDGSDKKSPKIVTWSPVVLSAKGYQAGYLLDAFTKWENSTAKARREFAPGVKAHFFFATVGTFGDKPKNKIVGTGKNTSPITPLELYQLPEINEDLLKMLFVGETLANDMLTLKNEARDWLDAWKTPKTEQKISNTENELPSDEQYPAEDELPM